MSVITWIKEFSSSQKKMTMNRQNDIILDTKRKHSRTCLNHYTVQCEFHTWICDRCNSLFYFFILIYKHFKNLILAMKNILASSPATHLVLICYKIWRRENRGEGREFGGRRAGKATAKTKIVPINNKKYEEGNI